MFRVRLQITDTAYSEGFDYILGLWMISMDVIILCYDISLPSSLENIEKFVTFYFASESTFFKAFVF